VAVALGPVLLTALITMRVHYGLDECRLVGWIREGISVYVFTKRNQMNRANRL
jgi:hypothetical protein